MLAKKIIALFVLLGSSLVLADEDYAPPPCIIYTGVSHSVAREACLTDRHRHVPMGAETMAAESVMRNLEERVTASRALGYVHRSLLWWCIANAC